MARARRAWPVAVLILCYGVAPAAAQMQRSVDFVRYDAPTPWAGWRGEAALAGANALLGGITSGIVRELRGGSFREGFTAGALGSTIAYSGRRLSVADIHGAGFAGRELNAIGASIVHNANAGRPALDLVVLPLGPLRLYLEHGRDVRLKLNAHETWWLARAALDPDLELLPGATASTGAPVFQRRGGRLRVGGEEVNGYQMGGTIFLSGEAGLGQAWTLSHETVHVLQSDFVAIAWLDGVEAELMRTTRATSALHRLIDPGVLDYGVRTALARGLRLRFVNSLQELEAELLESR